MSEDKQRKNVKLSVSTWKALMIIKIETSKTSIEEVVKEQVRDAGY